MYALMARYYENVKHEKFLRDLAEKEGVLLLYDHAGDIQGFTTFMIINALYHNETIAALYSGDTIVAQQFWGQLELFRVFGGLFRHLLLEIRVPLYWFLLTKGIRTYSLLPLFFKQFYPNYVSATPPYEQALIDHLARKKFGRCYLKEAGVVRVFPRADRLKESLMHIPQKKRIRPSVKFFLDRNPGYVDGDELVCLARISASNFTKTAQRFVRV